MQLHGVITQRNFYRCGTQTLSLLFLYSTLLLRSPRDNGCYKNTKRTLWLGLRHAQHTECSTCSNITTPRYWGALYYWILNRGLNMESPDIERLTVWWQIQNTLCKSHKHSWLYTTYLHMTVWTSTPFVQFTHQQMHIFILKNTLKFTLKHT